MASRTVTPVGRICGGGGRVGDHRIAHEDRPARPWRIRVVGDVAEGDAEGIDPPLGVIQALPRFAALVPAERQAHCGSTSSARRCCPACPVPRAPRTGPSTPSTARRPCSTPPSIICSRAGLGRRGWHRGRSRILASAVRGRPPRRPRWWARAPDQGEAWHPPVYKLDAQLAHDRVGDKTLPAGGGLVTVYGP